MNFRYVIGNEMPKPQLVTKTKLNQNERIVVAIIVVIIGYAILIGLLN